MKNKKKLMLGAFMLILYFGMMPNVFANEFTCNAFGGEVLIDEKIAHVISNIIIAIQIVVPILLVIYGMLDLGKAIMAQKEDEIKKGQQTLIKRCIAAIIFFFVIVIVKMIVNFVASDTDGVMSCANCFIQGPRNDSCQ